MNTYLQETWRTSVVGDHGHQFGNIFGKHLVHLFEQFGFMRVKLARIFEKEISSSKYLLHLPEIVFAESFLHSAYIGEVTNRYLLFFLNFFVHVLQVFNQIFFFTIFAKNWHFLLQLGYHQSVHLCQPTSLNQIVQFPQSRILW